MHLSRKYSDPVILHALLCEMKGVLAQARETHLAACSSRWKSGMSYNRSLVTKINMHLSTCTLQFLPCFLQNGTWKMETFASLSIGIEYIKFQHRSLFIAERRARLVNHVISTFD